MCVCVFVYLPIYIEEFVCTIVEGWQGHGVQGGPAG